MNRQFWLGAALMTAAAAGLFFLLGGPDALFGTSRTRGLEPEAAPPAEAGGPGDEAASGGASERGGRRPSAVLFGRPPAESRGVGSLRARVVRYDDRKPVAGARVAASGTGFGGEAVAAEATTDAAGDAFLEGVAAGAGYEVRVEAAADGALRLPGVDVAARRTTDLGTLYLGAKGVLAGRVVDEEGAGIAGADVRAFRGPLSLAEFFGNLGELFGTLDRDPEPLAKGTTDAAGRFGLADLAPGTYMVRATAPERKQAVVRVEMTPSGAAGAEPRLVLDRGAVVAGLVVDADARPVAGARLAFVGSGGDDPFSFVYGRVFAESDAKGAFRAVLPQEEGEVRAIVASEGFPTTMSGAMHAGDTDVRIVLRGGARLEVRVVEKAGGRPVEGAQVVVMVVDGSPGDDDSGGAMLVGTTDDRGEKSFAVRPGRVQMLFVTHPRHPGGAANSFSVGAEQGGIEVEGDFAKAIVAGGVARLVVRLQTGAVLVGRVLTPDGSPIAGAEVRPLSFAGVGAGSNVSARSGPDGAYRLEGIHPSPQTMVFVRAPGWVQPMDQAAVRDAPGANGEIVRDFTLRRAASVRGRVVDAEGKGVAGARVGVADDGPGTMFGALLGGGTPVVTAPDGTYVVGEVNPGGSFDLGSLDADPGRAAARAVTHRVTATADGWVRARSEPFRVAEGETTEAPVVVMSRGARLAGKVVDPGGRPVVGARVQAAADPEEDDFASLLDAATRIRNARTAAGGTFEFLTLPAGDVTLTATADRFAASRRTVPVAEASAAEEVEVRLRPALEVRGKVLDADGRPLAGARASIDGGLEGREGDEAWVQSGSAKSDAQGDFVLKGVPPGRVGVRVLAEGHRPTRAVLESGGAPHEFRLAAKAAGTEERLAEIRAEITQIGQKFMQAKDDAERTALQQRMLELMKEQKELQGSGEEGATRSDGR